MPNFIIRPVVSGDMEAIINLCELHAHYEGQHYDRTNKLEKLSQALFASPPALKCYVAEVDGDVVGYATATREFSTWNADYFLHMDCLFILESTRGAGVGLKLFGALIECAKQWQCSHIQWQTPSDNTRAIKFYERLGARSKAKERFFFDVPN